jgi:hypothetical protein
MKTALKVVEIMGTDIWKKAIDKEIKSVKPAFEFRDDNQVLTLKSYILQKKMATPI